MGFYMLKMMSPLLLLIFANVFMTFAWYMHLKDFNHKSLWFVILLSWGIAFFEYCLQVPANRLGREFFSLAQLKVMQEIITMIVFVGFSIWYMKIPVTKNLFYASLCLIGAAFFIFRDPRG